MSALVYVMIILSCSLGGMEVESKKGKQTNLKLKTFLYEEMEKNLPCPPYLNYTKLCEFQCKCSCETKTLILVQCAKKYNKNITCTELSFCMDKLKCEKLRWSFVEQEKECRPVWNTLSQPKHRWTTRLTRPWIESTTVTRILTTSPFTKTSRASTLVANSRSKTTNTPSNDSQYTVTTTEYFNSTVRTKNREKEKPDENLTAAIAVVFSLLFLVVIVVICVVMVWKRRNQRLTVGFERQFSTDSRAPILKKDDECYILWFTFKLKPRSRDTQGEYDPVPAKELCVSENTNVELQCQLNNHIPESTLDSEKMKTDSL